MYLCRSKWRPKPFEANKNNFPLIVWGDGQFADTMRGTVPSMAKRCNKLLKHAEYQGRLVMVAADEFKTSPGVQQS